MTQQESFNEDYNKNFAKYWQEKKWTKSDKNSHMEVQVNKQWAVIDGLKVDVCNFSIGLWYNAIMKKQIYFQMIGKKKN